MKPSDRSTLNYSLAAPPSIHDLGMFVSDLLHVSVSDIELFRTSNHKTLGSIKVEAPTFRLKSTIAPTRNDKHLGWYGGLINQAHKLLRLKGGQANAAFISENNDFNTQLSDTLSGACHAEFTHTYLPQLDAILTHASNEKDNPELERLKKILQNEVDTLKLLENPEQGASLLFLWQRLTAQQKIFEMSKAPNIPINLSNQIHTLVHSDSPDRWQNELSFGIKQLNEVHISLINPSNQQPIHLKVPYDKGKMIGSPAHHPAMTMIGLFAGRMLIDQDRAPKPLREFLSDIGVTTQITDHWQALNELITTALEKAGYSTDNAKKILEHNGLTISQSEMEPLQNAAMSSLQELEFIARISTSQTPNEMIRSLMPEIGKFAGPQIRSSAPIAETPRQLLVLCDRILNIAESNETMKRLNPTFLTILKERLNIPKSKYPTPMSDVESLTTHYETTEGLQLGELYRGKGDQLIRPEKAAALKAEVEKAIEEVSQRKIVGSEGLVSLLVMLKESLEANHNRHGELARGQAI